MEWNVSVVSWLSWLQRLMVPKARLNQKTADGVTVLRPGEFQLDVVQVDHLIQGIKIRDQPQLLRRVLLSQPGDGTRLPLPTFGPVVAPTKAVNRFPSVPPTCLNEKTLPRRDLRDGKEIEGQPPNLVFSLRRWKVRRNGPSIHSLQFQAILSTLGIQIRFCGVPAAADEFIRVSTFEVVVEDDIPRQGVEWDRGSRSGTFSVCAIMFQLQIVQVNSLVIGTKVGT
mmetsp:Transcript_114551/g.330933  ORF Transcript_114551/g.330933 Transcript_114551/m.330933 type:complete len:226 (+) Transcript_114551:90-767(+)